MNKRMKKESAGVAVAGGVFRIALYVFVAFIIIYAGKTAYGFGYAIFNQQPIERGDGKEVTVVVKKGTSVYSIGKVLKHKGLIEDAKVFVAQEKLSNYKGKLLPGTYILSTAMTTDEMLAILAREVTEGQPAQEAEKEDNPTQDGTDTGVYDKVSEEAEAGDTDDNTATP